MTDSSPATTKTPIPKSVSQRVRSILKLVLINFLVFALLAEFVSLILVNRKSWPASKPSYRLNYNSYWADINPSFGVWHRPNSHFVHEGGCFTVEYDTNSYGARDSERALHSSAPRTIVLGDSFVEGLGVPVQDRLSNILEKDTGREHLNFGTQGRVSAIAQKPCCAPAWLPITSANTFIRGCFGATTVLIPDTTITPAW